MAKAKGPLERKLQFEKKNQDMVKVPKYARIQKRPIPRPPVASPYAGASVPKTVYVSSATPFMSAVKRVQKLLRHAEKRAVGTVDLAKGEKKEKLSARLARGQEQLRREEVFVKATGRAIEKALAVGRWFEEREKEYVVRVTTGSVAVVDDIVEDEAEKQRLIEREVERKRKEEEEEEEEEKQDRQRESLEEEEGDAAAAAGTTTKKRKRATNHDSTSAHVELPETRVRWVKMVEIAVTLK